MYLPDDAHSNSNCAALELLTQFTESPQQACDDNPDVKAAFDEGLRQLAEDILTFHPSLAHLLIGMSEAPCPAFHGQN